MTKKRKGIEVQMTSTERREARYQRRKQKRHEKRRITQERYSFDELCKTKNWLKALKKCKKNVAWKGSVQWYYQHPISNTISALRDIRKMKYPYRPNNKRVTLYERGKKRDIVPITIEKRHVEHVFCDEILTPSVTRRLIHNNGASLEGKGTEFSRVAVSKALSRSYREYGSDFYYWQFDFKGFFNSISAKVCKSEFRELFDDSRIVGFGMRIMLDFHMSEIELCKDPEKKRLLQAEFDKGKSCGVCLGSQESQTTALIVPNKLDHFITNHNGIKYYVRYMDDGIVFHKSKEFLVQLYENCKLLCQKLGIRFSEKKTKICKISKGFTFLKVRYYLSKTGKIIKRIHRSSVVRMRRKLKRFFGLYRNGKIDMHNIYDSFQSWFNHCKKVAKTYRTRMCTLRLYIRLFGRYGVDNFLKKGGNCVLLQNY